MFAVISSGGKQYRVEEGTTLVIDRIDAEPGEAITLDRVLMLGEGEAVTIGRPTVPGAVVRATVVAQGHGPKVVVFKFKQKAKYRRRTGHRQELTSVRIDAIESGTAAEAKPKRTRRTKAAAGEDA